MFKNSPLKAFGIAWFTDRETYQKALSIFDDSYKLSTSYDEWLLQAEGLCEQIERAGKTPVKAIIDPDTFPEWCRDRGLNVDAAARMEFASLEAYKFIQKGS